MLRQLCLLVVALACFVALASADWGPPSSSNIPFITNDIINRSIAADDYGHIFHNFPDYVIFPKNDAQVAYALTWARARRYTVSVRGSGHGAQGQSQCRKCVVINMSNMKAVRAVSSTFVEIEAGAGIRVALEALRPLNRTIPAQTDWQDIATGGFSSVTSGLGPASFTASSVHDNLVSLTIVTGTGQILTVSPTSNSNLFDAARSGMGQFGIITALRFKAIPLPGTMFRVYHVISTLAQVSADYNKFFVQNQNKPFHQFETFPILNVPGAGAGIDPGYATYSPAGVTDAWIAIQEYGVFYNPSNPPNDATLFGQFAHIAGSELTEDYSYYDWIYRLDYPFGVILPATGAWYDPHPWFEVMLPLENAFTQINSILGQTTATDVPLYSVQSIIPLKKPVRPGKYQLLPDTNYGYYVYFGLLRQAGVGAPPTDEKWPEAVRLLNVNDNLRQQVISAGGTPVISSTIPATPEEWQVVMGWSKYNSFVLDKRIYDPVQTLNNNWNILATQVDDCTSFDRL